jgi:hypothetical protein
METFDRVKGYFWRKMQYFTDQLPQLVPVKASKIEKKIKEGLESTDFARDMNVLKRGIKLDVLLMIGFPVALLWSSSVFLLASAISIVGNVIMGSLKAFTSLLSAVSHVIFALGNGLTGNNVFMSENFRLFKFELQKVFFNMVGVLSAGILKVDFRRNTGMTVDNMTVDNMTVDKWTLKFNEHSPVVKEVKELYGQYQYHLSTRPTGDPQRQATDVPRYEGHFNALKEVILRIQREVNFADHLAPTSSKLNRVHR